MVDVGRSQVPTLGSTVDTVWGWGSKHSHTHTLPGPTSSTCMQHVPVNGNSTHIKTHKLCAKVGPGDTPCKTACEGHSEDKGQGWAEVDWPQQSHHVRPTGSFQGSHSLWKCVKCVSYPWKYPYCPLEVALSTRITSLQRLASESLPLSVLPSFWQAGGCDWVARAS